MWTPLKEPVSYKYTAPMTEPKTANIPESLGFSNTNISCSVARIGRDVDKIKKKKKIAFDIHLTLVVQRSLQLSVTG